MRLFSRTATLIALALTVLPASAVVAAPAFVQRVETQGNFTNTCNGELVLAEGTIEDIIKQNENGKYMEHYYIQGTGTGDQGNEYVFTQHQKITLSMDGFAESSSKLLLVSKGSAPNMVINVYFNSETGELTIDTDCTGADS